MLKEFLYFKEENKEKYYKEMNEKHKNNEKINNKKEYYKELFWILDYLKLKNQNYKKNNVKTNLNLNNNLNSKKITLKKNKSIFYIQKNEILISRTIQKPIRY